MDHKTTIWVAVIGVIILMTGSLAVYKLGGNKIIRKNSVVTNEATPIVVKGMPTTMTVKVVAYCPCALCNSEAWKGMVSTGKTIASFTDRGVNICATDPNVIPLGTTIRYDNKEYLSTDVGARIKGKIINILMNSHKEAQDFGVKVDQIIDIVNM